MYLVLQNPVGKGPSYLYKKIIQLTLKTQKCVQDKAKVNGKCLMLGRKLNFLCFNLNLGMY